MIYVCKDKDFAEIRKMFKPYFAEIRKMFDHIRGGMS